MKLFKKSRIGAIMILLLSNCTQICRKEFANADYLLFSERIIGIYLHEFIN